MKSNVLLRMSLWFIMASCMFAGTAMAQQPLPSLDFKWLHERRAAVVLFEQEKYDEALPALREVASTATNETQRDELLAYAARAQAHLGQGEQALTSAKAIKHPIYSQYAVLSILAEQDNAQQIITSFADMSFEDWPQDIRARSYHLRAKAYEALDKVQEAMADHERTVQAAGDKTEWSLPALMDIARFQQKLGKNEAAKDTYNRVIEMFGNPPRKLRGGHHIFPSVLTQMADMFVAEKNYEQAIQYIERYPATWSTSRSFSMLPLRGDLYRDWGKRDEALKAYREALAYAQENASHSRAPSTISQMNEKIISLESIAR